MNIRVRLTLWYSAILFIILAIFGVAIYVGLSRSLLAVLDNHLQREVGEMIGNFKFERHGDDEEPEPEGKRSQETQTDAVELELEYTPEEGVFWRILDTAGRTLVDPGHFDGASFDTTVIGAGHTQFEYATLANNIPIRLYTAPFIIEGQGEGIVQVAESYEHIQQVQRQLIFLLTVSIPFILLATSAGGWFLATNALAPIDGITRAAKQISASDLHQRLNLKLPDDEVGRLATTFDQMLARLEDAFQRQKRFIADASHEMRTPLTILKGDVEVALNRPRRPEEYQQTLRLINQSTDRLIRLVEELLLLARADNKQYLLQLEKVNLSELLTKEVADLIPRAVRKNIALSLDTPPVLPIEADPNKISRLFINLIYNAIKYSDPDGAISVTAFTENNRACITIADTGPGIPAEHLPHIFERFYQVDKARSRRTSNGEDGTGAGLGLSIAQWLAQIHGGSIEVASKMGQGSVFTVWLPFEPPQPTHDS